MKKDINPPTIKDVAVAVVLDKNELHQDIWNVYLINLQNQAIEGVLISSKGYFTDLKNQETKTSVLRHAIGTVDAKSTHLIEPIMEELFAIHNEYWVSFFSNDQLLDKKYIFLAETIKEENLINIPILNKRGVMIR